MSKVYLNTDFYKVSHAMDQESGYPALHPLDTKRVYETLTPRDSKWFPYDDKMVVFGYYNFVKNLVKDWNEQFFRRPWEEIEPDFRVFGAMSNAHVQESVTDKFKHLHDYGRLPLEIMALPEGTLVPMRVPVLSIVNTHSDFYWLPGYLETTLLSQTFVTSTVASVARQFRKIAESYAEKSAEDNAYVDFQFHDFSQRGQHGDQASVLSGIGHLSSFKGTDAVPAVDEVLRLYDDDGFIGGSVVATEHSIMQTLGGKYGVDTEGQIKAYESLIDRNPEGILSVVSDTYDYWAVIDDVMPALKDKIMARNGKLVIRPDSLAEHREKTGEIIPDVKTQLVRTLEGLYDTFGGTVNAKGYKVLDSHIGVLHGEGVTIDTVGEYFDAILEAGFSAENIVFGVGAYVYSVKVSRDDFGQALKASAAVIGKNEVETFKQPKSEAEAFKRSPKGAVSIHGKSGSYEMVEHLTIEGAKNDPENQMKMLYQDLPDRRSYSLARYKFNDIRAQITKDIDL